MKWLEKANFFEENKVYASDVIACSVILNNYGVGEKDDFDNWTISEDTFEVLANYIVDWLDSTVIEYDLVRDVFDGLMCGLRRKDFTLDNIRYDEDEVRDYINDMI